MYVDNAEGRVWNRSFESDTEVWDCFLNTVRNEGIEAIVGPPIARKNRLCCTNRVMDSLCESGVIAERYEQLVPH